MTRYIRDLRRAIALASMKGLPNGKKGKLTTLSQYWVVDTAEIESIGIIIPTKSPDFNIKKFERKMDKLGWVMKKPIILNNSGRSGVISFYNLVFHFVR
jgi:hypothetical protein